MKVLIKNQISQRPLNLKIKLKKFSIAQRELYSNISELNKLKKIFCSHTYSKSDVSSRKV